MKKVLVSRNHRDSRNRPTACLGFFAAADHLGLGIVEGIAPHLLLRTVSKQTLEDFGLREASSGESTDIFVRQPMFPECTFRGAIRHKNVWATDILQTWLDTGHHRARGLEQAKHIERNILSSLYSDNKI